LDLNEFFCFKKSSTQHYEYLSYAAVISCHSQFADMSCYWCVADWKNWMCSIVTIWQTEDCWRGLGHCMDWHLCVSLGVSNWLPKHCPRFFIDLPWLP